VAESFLMRAGRGAGVGGLAAMPRLRSLETTHARLVRPLLDWTRSELRALVDAAGLVPVEDPTNADERFDRTRARRLIAETPELSSDRLARAAHNLRDVADAIQWVLEREYPSRVVDDTPDEITLRMDGLPFELKRQFVILAIEDLRIANGKYEGWRKTGVANFVLLLEAGRSGMLAEVCGRVTKDSWCLRLAPPRRTG
jgi:tRNA(Ile)-lysidine synthase